MSQPVRLPERRTVNGSKPGSAHAQNRWSDMGWGSRLVAVPVWGYRLLISPWLPPACRYQPTCSEYALEALRHHGPFKGTLLAARRVARCHPWGGQGYDPVPGTDDPGCGHDHSHDPLQNSWQDPSGLVPNAPLNPQSNKNPASQGTPL